MLGRHLLCVLLLTSVDSQAMRRLKRVRRVIGGTDALIQDFPYQVSIGVYGYHLCGGSIISLDWIVTAAHCLKYPASVYYIRSGSSFVSKGGYQHKVDKIYKHYFYFVDKHNRPNHDIALMHVRKPFTFNFRQQPIPLVNYGEEIKPGSIGIVSGWGETEWGKPSQLQVVAVPIISRMTCHSKYFVQNGIPESQICAGHHNGGKDACRGDSGGPLVVHGRLVGITSWAIGCAEAAFPGIYTEISDYRLWIEQITGV